MLQVKLGKDGGYELTDRQATVNLKGPAIHLADRTINQPGEYEAQGVEVMFGTQAGLVVWEHLQIAYVFSTEKPETFEKTQFSSSDVLLLAETATELTKSVFDELISAYDPRVVIFNKNGRIESGFQESLKLQAVPLVKLGTANLPTEGREYYLLG